MFKQFYNAVKSSFSFVKRINFDYKKLQIVVIS